MALVRIETILNKSLLLTAVSVCVFTNLINTSEASPYILLPNDMQFQPDSSIANSYDCTQVGIDDIDTALLTKEEKIALMDKSLNSSMDAFSYCVGITQEQMVSTGLGNGNEGNQTGRQNNANLNDDDSLSESNDTLDTSEEITLETQKDSVQEAVKGTTPTDRRIIPPKDNDKVICKLLYQEIKKTNDKAMQEGLKQQYANYKCG